MFRSRVIPCLQLNANALVKTVRFKKPSYIGDPINTVRIFNELEVDELCFLDIRATADSRLPDIGLLKEIASECFMPLSYGGGINSVDCALEILSIGFEKVVLNSCLFEDKSIIKQIADIAGSQSIVVAVDYKKNLFGKYVITSNSGKKSHSVDPRDWVAQMQDLGAGEILLNSIDREGTWSGFDHPMIQRVSEGTKLPVIALRWRL